ncbi:MAG: gamma-glutamyltransferase [Saprospiraceae bacterium]|nr:gamma-glutamyltransferase [Saprospiraceae bacterium]
MKYYIHIICICLVSTTLFNFTSCKLNNPAPEVYNITKSASGINGVVVTAHPIATEIGLDILKKGGNAVDAAIAVQFALAVCYPGAGNIGGGGFMVYRDKDGGTFTLDYREKAPAKATTDMYLDSAGLPEVEKSLYGHLAAGVPGTVDGMVQAFEKFSKLKNWEQLLAPAIEIAEKGYPITGREAKNLNEKQPLFIKYNSNQTAFHKEVWTEGDTLKQKELAKTLSAIMQHKRDGFYAGWVADAILAEMNAGGGIITSEVLKNYQSKWREPIVSDYRGHKIISMPPPSSGGVALIQLLKMVEPYNLSAMKFHSPEAIHLIIEAERRVYADRAKHLGDPDYYKVPVQKLIDSTYLQNRMKDFDPRAASMSENIQAGNTESLETTHFSIVDSEGNAVSMTTTLNGGYGSFTVVSGAGFLLNNEMDDFSVKPGSPNLYGLVGAEANKIEPGKRMLSSMTPTIIEKDNKLFMVVGTPGGSTIITSVFQTIINVIDFGMSIVDAVHAPRFHHQWLPDEVKIESDCFTESTKMVLTSLGHKLVNSDPIGRVEAICIDNNGMYVGAADIRGDDDAKAY